jgi:hypothetical protein
VCHHTDERLEPGAQVQDWWSKDSGTYKNKDHSRRAGHYMAYISGSAPGAPQDLILLHDKQRLDSACLSLCTGTEGGRKRD